MKSIIFILIGLIIFIIGLYMVFKFLAEFNLYINKLNDFVQTTEFGLISDLKEELDELNNSYYDILERQDERITNLEIINKVVEKKSKILYDKKSENTDSKNDEDYDFERKVIKLYKEGKSLEEISILLERDYQAVAFICSLNEKGN